MVGYIQAIEIWFQIFLYPFSNFSFLWRMIPIYFNGVFTTIYSPRPSNSSAVFSGFVALWAGADWIRTYLSGELIASEFNWIIAITFCAYGFISLIVGVTKKESLYKIFGRRSILTFFAISFYPIQTGKIYGLDSETILAILIVAVPMIILLEIFAFMVRKILRVDSTQSYSPSPTKLRRLPRMPSRRFRRY